MHAAASPQAQEWIDGFLFVANRPILDLLNTKPVLADGPTELLPDFRALERWLIASETVTSPKAKATLRSWRHSAEAAAFLKQLHRVPRKTARHRSSHGARTRTCRYLPNPSQFIIDAISSPRVTPQTRRKGHPRNIVRASPANRPLGPHHRRHRRSSRGTRRIAHSHVRIMRRSLLRHQQKGLTPLVQHEHLRQQAQSRRLPEKEAQR